MFVVNMWKNDWFLEQSSNILIQQLSFVICSVEEVCEALRSDGLREVRNMSDISELTFCRDPLCPDTLIFSQHRHALLQHSSLTMTHALNIQVGLCVCSEVSHSAKYRYKSLKRNMLSSLRNMLLKIILEEWDCLSTTVSQWSRSVVFLMIL